MTVMNADRRSARETGSRFEAIAAGEYSPNRAFESPLFGSRLTRLTYCSTVSLRSKRISMLLVSTSIEETPLDVIVSNLVLFIYLFIRLVQPLFFEYDWTSVLDNAVYFNTLLIALFLFSNVFFVCINCKKYNDRIGNI